MITGDLTLGALVAVVGAYKELYSPVEGAINRRQLTWDSQISSSRWSRTWTFVTVPTISRALQSADPIGEMPLTGLLRAST